MPILTRDQVIQARREARAGRQIAHIARRLNTPYYAVHNAIRGHTWKTITSEPPLPNGQPPPPKRFCRNPLCNLDMRKGYHRAQGLCQACYQYIRKHGKQRDPANLPRPNYKAIPEHTLTELYNRYHNGASIQALAVDQPFSAETLRRRFTNRSWPIRPNVTRKLNANLVQLARWYNHVERIPATELAHHFNQNYITLITAINGNTWKEVAGPTSHKFTCCQRCGLKHNGVYCNYCQEELRQELGILPWPEFIRTNHGHNPTKPH